MGSVVRALGSLLLLIAVAAPAFAGNPRKPVKIYGRQLMSPIERRVYRYDLEALESDAERRAYRDAHVVAMQRRAIARGVSLQAPREALTKENSTTWYRAPYFREIMTSAEVSRYRADLDALETPMERRRYVADHIVRMQARGHARGVSVPPAFDFADIFDALGEPVPNFGLEPPEPIVFETAENGEDAEIAAEAEFAEGEDTEIEAEADYDDETAEAILESPPTAD